MRCHDRENSRDSLLFFFLLLILFFCNPRAFGCDGGCREDICEC